MSGFAQARSAKFAGLTGDPVYFDSEVASTPGTVQTTVTGVCPTGKKWQLSQLYLNCCQNGEITIYIDSQIIGSGIITESGLNFFLNWFPARPMTAGETVAVKFRQNSGTASKTVRTHLQLTEETI